jgi:hypothetical protein
MNEEETYQEEFVEVELFRGRLVKVSRETMKVVLEIKENNFGTKRAIYVPCEFELSEVVFKKMCALINRKVEAKLINYEVVDMWEDNRW